MEGSDGEETYQDVASDEIVRPSGAAGAGNSVPEALEGEPDYGLSRDEASMFQAAELSMNPNLGMDEDENIGRMSRAFHLSTGDMVRNQDEVQNHDPPYEQMSVDGGRAGGIEPTLRDISEGTASISGKGVGSGLDERPRLLQQVSSPQRMVPRGNPVSPTGTLLNGELKPPLCERSQMIQGAGVNAGEPAHAGTMDQSIELLIHQLLRQNAALQQELYEARLSSGSGSNVSQEGRSEGRGAGRTVGQVSRVQGKGKGLGSDGSDSKPEVEPGRVFRPPWTSFTTPPESLSSSQVIPALPPQSLPPPQPTGPGIAIHTPRQHAPGLGEITPTMTGASACPGFGQVASLPVQTSKLGVNTAQAIPVVWPEALGRTQDHPQNQDFGMHAQAGNLGMLGSYCTQQRVQSNELQLASRPQRDDARLASPAQHQPAYRPTDNDGSVEVGISNTQNLGWSSALSGSALGPSMGLSQNWLTRDHRHQPAESTDKVQAQLQALSLRAATHPPPPPSVTELEAPPSVSVCPPLPQFSVSRGKRQAVQLVIDGVPREGVIDETGRIQLGGPTSCSICSDDERKEEGKRMNSCAGLGNPFAPGAASPFQELASQASPEASLGSPPVPPPPPPVSENCTRGYRRRSPSPRTPNTKRTSWGTIGMSPATVGGTRVPPSPPPLSPPSAPVSCQSGRSEGTPLRASPANETSSNERDFVPKKRTMWELPKLGGVSEPQPAMRCNDWLHRIQPSINDLAPKAFVWWRVVIREAKDAYSRWCAAGPLDRVAERGEPSEYLRSEKFVRLESRALAMLCKALPQGIYDLALSCRNTTCVGLIYLTLKTYQPGGLNERSELLKGLTSLSIAQTAAAGVSAIQSWFRHLERARSMEISIPDCSLLIEGLDKMSSPLLEKHPNLQFRMHSIRMHLQLDTVPSMLGVEQWAKSLLAEMEILAVSGVEGGMKRTRVAAAAVGGKGGKDAITPPKAEPRKPDPGSKEACKHWASDTGCKRGRNCNFSHALEKPGKCWTCGGSHQKSECQAPGGGKGPTPEVKPKAKVPPPVPKEGAKGSGKNVIPKPPPPNNSSPEAAAALKEATQLLQSLRLAKLNPSQEAVTRLKKLAEADCALGLIDGGATACLRTASEEELHLPTTSVQLAAGECQLHVNGAGTLLSKSHVAPIVSVAALLKLGYSITWTNQHCDISHPLRGKLEVDTSSGCPEVSASTALDLIRDYETLVGKRQVRETKIRRMVEDLRILDDKGLVAMIRSEGSEAEASLRVLLARRFPSIPHEVLEQLVTPVQEVCEEHTWNRRARRRQLKCHGLLIHMFCGKSRQVFETHADKLGLAHVAIDAKENLLRQSTYQHLLLEAIRGRIKLLVGGPPCRTNSVCRYFPLSSTNQGPRPIRVRSQSICHMDHDYLSGTEVAMRQVDDLLYLRFLALFVVAAECNRDAGLPDPGFALEQPEDPEVWACNAVEWSGDQAVKLEEVRPESGFSSFWSTPEWESVAGAYSLHTVSFDQGPLLHCKRKPTTLGTNMRPAAELLDCRGPGTDCWNSQEHSISKSKVWSEWAPGLIASLGHMMVDWMQEGHKRANHALRKLDPSFIEHVRQQHVPYRRDCKFCVQGGSKQRQHRRVLTPQMWSLSVDTAGPFVAAQDEVTKKARYFVIGVLTVPKFVAKAPDPPEEPAAPEAEAAEDPEEDEDIAGLLEAADWLAAEDAEPDRDKPALGKEEEAGKEAWKKWMNLVEGDQEAWRKEAESQYLPKVEVVDWVFLEPVATKNTTDVLTAIGRMYASAKAEGFDVRRLHSDRGREFNNNQMRAWCARHGIHKTLAIPEEHQSNGRAEGAIMRAKGKIRTLLQAAGCNPEEWPLAARLAAHTFRNVARRRLNMPVRPSVPYNSKVQVLQRSWSRGVWESLTITAYTKAPSGDSTRGWIVKTADGRLLTTGALFPSPKHQQEIEITCKGDPVAVSEPERRIRGKTTLKELQHTPNASNSISSAFPCEQLARKYLEDKNFSMEAIVQVLIRT